MTLHTEHAHTDALWTPSPTQAGKAQITDLMAFVNARHGRSLHDYAGLHRFSKV